MRTWGLASILVAAFAATGCFQSTFAFADISRLQFKQGGASSDDEADKAYATSVGAPEVRFALTRQPDGHALLKIMMPPARMPTASVTTAPAGSGARPQSRVPPEQLAMVKQMFAGMRITIAVEPAGELVKTSSPFVDG